MQSFLQLLEAYGCYHLVATRGERNDCGEFAGPCPWCGGGDRFRVFYGPRGIQFWCQACGRMGDQAAFLAAAPPSPVNAGKEARDGSSSRFAGSDPRTFWRAI